MCGLGLCSTHDDVCHEHDVLYLQPLSVQIFPALEFTRELARPTCAKNEGKQLGGNRVERLSGPPRHHFGDPVPELYNYRNDVRYCKYQVHTPTFRKMSL